MNDERVLQEAVGLLDAMLLFVGPQDVPRPLGHLARGGHIPQEHETAGLVRLARHALRPLVHGDLQAIPPRFDHTWPRGARPPRALLGMLLDHGLQPVIGALHRPELGGAAASASARQAYACGATSRLVAASVAKDAWRARARCCCRR
jgi:hypothetical protein